MYDRTKNHIFFGNCLKLMKNIENQSIDLVLCDLPYGTTKCKWDIVIPFHKLWKHYNRIVKENGAIILFGTEPFSSTLRLSNLEMFRYDWYWEKSNGSNWRFANNQPLRVIEIASVFYKKQPTYNPQKVKNPKGYLTMHLGNNPAKISKYSLQITGEPKKEIKNEKNKLKNFHGRNYEPDKLLPRQLVYFHSHIENRLHPTQKPIPLLEYLVKTYTNPGDLVLDHCAGSGTTGIACINTKRQFILMEKNPDYYKEIKKRIDMYAIHHDGEYRAQISKTK